MPPESLTDTKSVSQFLRGSVERHFLGAIIATDLEAAQSQTLENMLP